jgi:hypothetical protein
MNKIITFRTISIIYFLIYFCLTVVSTARSYIWLSRVRNQVRDDLINRTELAFIFLRTTPPIGLTTCYMIVPVTLWEVPSVLENRCVLQPQTLNILICKKSKANRSCDNHVIYQLKLRSLRDTLGVFYGLYIYIRSG